MTRRRHSKLNYYRKLYCSRKLQKRFPTLRREKGPLGWMWIDFRIKYVDYDYTIQENIAKQSVMTPKFSYHDRVLLSQSFTSERRAQVDREIIRVPILPYLC